MLHNILVVVDSVRNSFISCYSLLDCVENFSPSVVCCFLFLSAH